MHYTFIDNALHAARECIARLQRLQTYVENSFFNSCFAKIVMINKMQLIILN